MLTCAILLWVLCLPGAYVAGVCLGYGLPGMWGVITAYRLVQAGVFTWLWQARRWKQGRI